jgi:ribonuclease P protein subunit RPR2
MSVQIAKHRIKKLFSEADKVFSKSPKLANRYIHLARRIAMKVNLSLPKYQKRKFCKHCYHYLKPGKNSRTRIHKHRIIIYCQDCKKYTRIPIKPRK